MRENIFELISGNELDLLEEYKRLNILFEKTQLYCANYFLNLVEAGFFDWKYRNRFLSAKEMMSKLKINEKSMLSDMTMNKLLLYIEFIYNTLLPKDFSSFMDSDKKVFLALFDNMISVLNDLNYEVIKKEDEKYIITEKNAFTSCIAEIKPEISDIVIEYRRFSLKGNIGAKKEILTKLAEKIEPLKKKLTGNNYKSIVEDINMLLNNLNIRHNNFEGKYRKEYTVNMSSEELESWYDTTYDMILNALLLEKYIDKKKALEELRSKY